MYCESQNIRVDVINLEMFLNTFVGKCLYTTLGEEENDVNFRLKTVFFLYGSMRFLLVLKLMEGMIHFLFRKMLFSFSNNIKKSYILSKKLKSQFQRSVPTELTDCQHK